MVTHDTIMYVDYCSMHQCLKKMKKTYGDYEDVVFVPMICLSCQAENSSLVAEYMEALKAKTAPQPP